ncbi:MAG: M20/M25/M40 family metallo-hydrolase, partial [Halobacteriaceae archaeon]
ITVDERTIPGERISMNEMNDLAGISHEVNQDLPPMKCNDEEFANTSRSVARDVQDLPARLTVKPHATDAGWLFDAGTSTVIIGPAEMGEAHTAEESVSIDALTRCRDIYLTMADRWPVSG